MVWNWNFFARCLIDSNLITINNSNNNLPACWVNFSARIWRPFPSIVAGACHQIDWLKEECPRTSIKEEGNQVGLVFCKARENCFEFAPYFFRAIQWHFSFQIGGGGMEFGFTSRLKSFWILFHFGRFKIPWDHHVALIRSRIRSVCRNCQKSTRSRWLRSWPLMLALATFSFFQLFGWFWSRDWVGIAGYCSPSLKGVT